MLKELYFYGLYMILALFFIFTLSLKYAPFFISAWCNYLEEGLVLHDTTEWVWAVWITAFFLTFWSLLPYYFYLVYIWIYNLNTRFENLLLKIFFCLFFYNLNLSWLIFVNDLFVSGFLLPEIQNISFEFQPGIETYLNFIFGFFFDLFNSFFLFQCFLILIYLFKHLFCQVAQYMKILYFFSLFLFLYWFGGEGIVSDLFLCCIIIFCDQLFLYLVLILKHLRMYKNI